MDLASAVRLLNQNKIFKFVSSIRLAVPAMLCLCVCVAWGTVVESMYNADYAALVVYKSWWFSILMMVLWLNIFCATVSRYPFKKHHTGFVITHIGLLTLLIGGMITNSYGIDGQLQVMEGGKNSTVMLSRLMVGYQSEGSPSVQKMVFDRSLTPKNEENLDFINKEMGAWFKVKNYLPFARVEKSYNSSPTTSDETSVSFILKSAFFNVTEWLSTAEENEKQMGPATLRIVKGAYVSPKKMAVKKSTPALQTKRTPKKASGEASVLVFDVKSEKEIQKIPVSKLLSKSLSLNGVTIALKKKLKNAIVAANKLEEGDPAGSNPALEFEITKGSESKREILYAKYETFSLHPEGVFGLRLRFAGGASETAAGEEDSQEKAMPVMDTSGAGGNLIEFHIPEGREQKVQVVLSKNGEFVHEAWLKPGESLQTPWMGMQIFITSVIRNSQASIVARPVALEKKSNLPPSAVEISLDATQPSLWLSEGEEREVVVGNKRVQVFYGRENFNLPFEIALQKFSKIDYPGTETPLSYESDVQVNGSGPVKKISMNEPLKLEGYTIYQASYSLQPNAPPISVFSVNKDPGRFWKYLGSIILSLGVIIYTLMKSRLYRKEREA